MFTAPFPCNFKPAGVAPPATPDALWIKGDDPDGTGTPPAPGTMMSLVHDFSSAALDLSNGGGASRPTYNGGYWSYPHLGGATFNRPTIVGPFDYSHFFVVAQLNALARGDFLIDSGTTGMINRYFMAMDSSGIRIERESGGSVGIGTGSYTAGQTYLVTGIFAGAGSVLRLNAGLVSASGSITATSSPGAGIRIGDSVSSTNGFEGSISEVMAYSVAAGLNPTQVAIIESYLMLKYGL